MPWLKVSLIWIKVRDCCELTALKLLLNLCLISFKDSHLMSLLTLWILPH